MTVQGCEVDYYTWVTTPIGAACPACGHAVAAHTVEDKVCAACNIFPLPDSAVAR